MNRTFVVTLFLAGALTASAAVADDPERDLATAVTALRAAQAARAAGSECEPAVVALKAARDAVEAALADGDFEGDADAMVLAWNGAQAATPPPQPAPPAPPNVFVVGGRGSYLGVGVADIDSDRVRELKLKDEHGVEITRVEEDSPAAKAGIQKGDVVLEYQGQRVEGMDQFQRLVRETPPGRQVKLHISRNGSSQTITATIGDRKNRAMVQAFGPDSTFERDMKRMQEQLGRMRFDMPDVPTGMMSWRTGTLGITAESLGPQLAEFFGVKEGVLVREVNKDSAADKAGLKAGDVITKIDQATVSSPQQVTQAIRKQHDKTTFPVTVVRNKQEMVLNVTVEQPRSSQWYRGPDAIVAPTPAPRPIAPKRFTL